MNLWFDKTDMLLSLRLCRCFLLFYETREVFLKHPLKLKRKKSSIKMILLCYVVMIKGEDFFFFFFKELFDYRDLKLS